MTAKIKLNAASGGGSISIQAPSSSSNNRVISLPDIADGTLLTSQSSLDSTKLSPAVSGDFVKLQVASAAGGTGDLIFDNLDVSTYKHFDLHLSFIPSTDNVSPRMQFRQGGASGSNISSGHHQIGYQFVYPTNTQNEVSSQGNSDIYLAPAMGNASDEGITMQARISFADSSDNGGTKNIMNSIFYSFIMRTNSKDHRHGIGQAYLTHDSDAFPTGFKFDTTSGNIGNYSYALYGLKR